MGCCCSGLQHHLHLDTRSYGTGSYTINGFEVHNLSHGTMGRLPGCLSGSDCQYVIHTPIAAVEVLGASDLSAGPDV